MSIVMRIVSLAHLIYVNRAEIEPVLIAVERLVEKILADRAQAGK